MAPNTPSGRSDGHNQAVAQLSVRIPDDLHARIKAIAANDGVSLNVWLCLAAAEKAAGTLRAEDVKRLDEIEKRVEALEGR
jgi:uncharacterized protein (DUF1778 family)